MSDKTSWSSKVAQSEWSDDLAQQRFEEAMLRARCLPTATAETEWFGWFDDGEEARVAITRNGDVARLSVEGNSPPRRVQSIRLTPELIRSLTGRLAALPTQGDGQMQAAEPGKAKLRQWAVEQAGQANVAKSPEGLLQAARLIMQFVETGE